MKTFTLTNFIIVAIITSSLNIGIISVKAPAQVYWYQQYVKRTNTNGYDYHILGMKYYNDIAKMDNTIPPNPRSTNPYLVLYKRDTYDILNNPPQIIRKMYFNNYSSYDYLSFYFPNMDASHVKPYVIWNLAIDCLGFTKFNIKFFNCDGQATDFYTTTLTGVGNKLRYSNVSNTFASSNYSAPSDCGSRTNPITTDTELGNLFKNYNSVIENLLTTPASNTCTPCLYQ